MKLDEILKGSYQRYIAKDFLTTQFFNKRIPLVLDCVERGDISDVQARLLDCCGDVALTLEINDEDVRSSVAALSEYNDKDIDAIIVEGIRLVDCKRFDFSDLEQIMHRLRADDGCEWDRAQTHESIRINLIEEAYELVEAIDRADAEMIKEECGDILMQAVFHAEIAKKNGEFNYIDMVSGLCRKLIDRHTHIFGENHASCADEALVFWELAKKKEKKYKSVSDQMDRVPKNLPSLLYAEKLQKYAKKAGFDWADVSGAYDKLFEEADELKSASEGERFEEAGDLLFAAVNVLRFYKIDPEMALREACNKFFGRFSEVERIIKARGKDMKACSLEELDEAWEDVKALERAAD